MDRAEVKELFWNFAAAKSTEELWQYMETFCQDWRLVHARISIYDVDAAISPSNFLHVRAYPAEPQPGKAKTWSQHYLDQRLYDHDRSFHLIFEHATSHMLWTRMDELTRSSSEASRVFFEMREFGIGEGVLVGRSSLIERRTALLGIAGPTKSFNAYKGELWTALIHALQVFLASYLTLAEEEGLLASKKGSDNALFSPRELEILKLMSLDKETPEIADLLGITTNGVNEALKRMRKKTGLKTRTGILALAISSKQIAPTKD